MTSDQIPGNQSPVKRSAQGISPYRVHELCRELATGEKTRTQLALEHGVTGGAITRFAQRHKARIEEIKAHLDDEFAGLWVAAKANRIAAYQRELELLDGHPSAKHHEWSKARQSALRAIAEELGQLPSRGVAVTGEVKHILEGVSLEDLT